MKTLEQIKKHTKVVADTGDFQLMVEFQPVDATTNPSLIFKSAQDQKYQYIIDKAIEAAENDIQEESEKLDHIIDLISVSFGIEILKIIPGRVSTEVNADLSFNTKLTLKKARKIISLYEKQGINRDRILIKIAATWEGIKAAEILENEGIKCNLTLIFDKTQAIACAEAEVTLISPFVGRILDWYKQNTGLSHYDSDKDPGVLSVSEIYCYFKKFGYNTEIMGASFRNIDQIIELTGCDLLTISPNLLSELATSSYEITPKLTVENAKNSNVVKTSIDENTFRWNMNENEMANEKLSQGIRVFNADLLKLKNFVVDKLI